MTALTTGSASAQSADPVNLFEQSRNLRAETREAAAREDWGTAQRTNRAALALQPGHPIMLGNQVLIESASGSDENLLLALEELAASGLGFDLEGLDRADDLQATAPERFAELTARLAANAAPVGTADIHVQADLSDILIEGVAVDIETERVFLGSVSDRRIYVFEHGSNDPEVFADERDGLWSVFGLAVDARNRVLYAASGVVPQTPMDDDEEPGTAIFVFDLGSGRRIAQHTIDGAGRIADFTVRDGVVYASDAENARVYRLNGPQGRLQVFAEDARFASLQGVAVTGGAVWVADYAQGLWRIDPVDGAATLASLPLTGESLIGLDGLATGLDGTIYAVRNGVNPHGVLKLDLDPEGHLIKAEPILTQHPAFGDHGEPTLLHILDGRAFLMANAQWSLFPEDGSEPEAERSSPVVLTWRVENPQ